MLSAGFSTASDPARGYDHGTFVPLKVAFPEANVPVLQLLLVAGLNARTHLAMVRALEPLRDEGVLIVASGMSFHNMRAFFQRGGEVAAESLDAWLRETVTAPSDESDARLEQWERAPHARFFHPREEHLVPLMVAASAVGKDGGVVPHNGTFVGLRISAVPFG